MLPPHCQIYECRKMCQVATINKNRFYLEGELKVLSSPHKQTRIVAPDFQEVISVDSKQTASVCWSPKISVERVKIFNSYQLVLLQNNTMWQKFRTREDYMTGYVCFPACVVSTCGIYMAVKTLL
jgi:hypothetical protein